MAKKAELAIYTGERQAKLHSRLGRIEGQVRGIDRMVHDQRPCVEVLEQLASTQAALRSVTKEVLRNYLENCATDAIRSDDPAIYDQLMEAIYKFAR